MKRIYVNVTDNQYAALKQRADLNGNSIAENIRSLVAKNLRLPTLEDRISELKKIVSADEYEIRHLATRSLRDLELEQHLDDGKCLLARFESELGSMQATGEACKATLARTAEREAQHA